ncbi:FecR family protein [Steroidobacter flavus]|uniref:FecR family protein n=1 Tax=Steroidobacter flavus TaxID=1842136 RepID=A0ABV8SP49_9GAMM
MAVMEREPVDALREEATIWVMRLQEQPAQASLQASVEAWKARSPAHAAAFDEMRALLGVLHQPMRRLAERRRNRRRAFALAASVLAAVLLGVGPRDRIADLQSDAVTAAGEFETLRLSDGSTVTLNTGTAIAKSDGDRGVTMYRGEAYFEIAHDPQHPFVIAAGDARVRVLGTRFNVKMQDEQVIVTVDDGRVELAPVHGSTQTLQLTAGMQGFVEQDQVRQQTSFDPQSAVAWRERKAIFYDAPFETVVADLNRYRRGPILIADADARARRVTGVFNLPDTEQALGTIERTLQLRVTRLPFGVTVIY